MSRSRLVYLDDIIQAIKDIEEFTSGTTHEQFLTDRKTQHACIRDLGSSEKQSNICWKEWRRWSRHDVGDGRQFVRGGPRQADEIFDY